MAGDVGAALAAAAAAYAIGLGEPGTLAPDAIHLWLGAALPAAWVLCMALCRAYEFRLLGVGAEEFRRLLTAAVWLTATVGTIAWALQLTVARGYVVVALPLATALTLLSRHRLRRGLHRRRARGECRTRVVAVGHAAAVADLVRHLRRADHHGMHVAAACVPGGAPDADLGALGVPVLGGLDDVPAVVATLDADTVAVLGSPELDGPALRRLGWALESTRAELVLVPALIEAIGPRVAVRPVCGLPLLHLARPELTGIRRLAKSALDWAGASVGIVVLAPLLLAVALVVRLNSRGPVLFRQVRVGRDGREFTMLKFRTMVVDAEARLDELLAAEAGSGRVLFKMRSDPRITRVGRVLRRYSLDELPQLFNVVLGNMSLVGPRPPLPREVEQYAEDVRRRLLVKPGLTGLWQVNGRSDLDWQESVRLDLRYVENWSFALDLAILWRTVAVVVRGEGAY